MVPRAMEVTADTEAMEVTADTEVMKVTADTEAMETTTALVDMEGKEEFSANIDTADTAMEVEGTVMATVTAMELERAMGTDMDTATEAARVTAMATEAARVMATVTEAAKVTGIATTTEAAVATGTVMA